MKVIHICSLCYYNKKDANEYEKKLREIACDIKSRCSLFTNFYVYRDTKMWKAKTKVVQEVMFISLYRTFDEDDIEYIKALRDAHPTNFGNYETHFSNDIKNIEDLRGAKMFRFK